MLRKDGNSLLQELLVNGKLKDNTFIHPQELKMHLDEARLSIAQISAIKMALHQKITIIKGPPGTGKTTVLKEIVKNWYLIGDTCSNSKILVSA